MVRWRMASRKLVARIALTTALGCGSPRSNDPTGPSFDVTGTDWTTAIAVARRAVGSTCATTPVPNSRFSRCESGDADVHIFGADGRISLIADGARLAGYTVDFSVGTCTSALSQRVAEHYHVSQDVTSKTSVYTIGTDGVVWFRECRLVVGSPAYADYYEAFQLGQGFRNLGGAFGPH